MELQLFYKKFLSSATQGPFERVYFIGSLNSLFDCSETPSKIGWNVFTQNAAGIGTGNRMLYRGMPRDVGLGESERKPHAHSLVAVNPLLFTFTEQNQYIFAPEPAQAIIVWMCTALFVGMCDFLVCSLPCTSETPPVSVCVAPLSLPS